MKIYTPERSIARFQTPKMRAMRQEKNSRRSITKEYFRLLPAGILMAVMAYIIAILFWGLYGV